MLSLVFVPEITGKDEILNQLNEPQLKVHLSDGAEQNLENPYRF
jgi:hypothetical protein